FSKMLQRALEQVNAHHDSHQVQAEFTKRSRAIEKMRITIGLKHQRQLGLEVPAEPPPDLVRAITSLGLSAKEAANIALAQPRPYLEAQIAYVRRRLSDRERGPIKVPAAYFRSAVAGNYAAFVMPEAKSPAAPLPAPPTAGEGRGPEDSTPAPREASNGAGGPKVSGDQARAPSPFAEVRAWYSELPDDQRAELAAAFLAQASPVVRQAIERRGMESAIAANSFYSWLRDARK
ncbi:MAG: hypothetical protein WCA12_01770, partial [Burkholderiales bacterium]